MSSGYTLLAGCILLRISKDIEPHRPGGSIAVINCKVIHIIDYSKING
jgi:hypothetical protein